MKRANQLIIKGKVQGVFYRASAKKIADNLGISGWIQNASSGDVEAFAAGPEEQVVEFIEWCKKGPLGAIVTEVIVLNAEDDPTLNGFHIRR